LKHWQKLQIRSAEHGVPPSLGGFGAAKRNGKNAGVYTTIFGQGSEIGGFLVIIILKSTGCDAANIFKKNAYIPTVGIRDHGSHARMGGVKLKIKNVKLKIGGSDRMKATGTGRPHNQRNEA
jgi:hypothetical protein